MGISYFVSSRALPLGNDLGAYSLEEARQFHDFVVVHSNPDKLCAIKGGRYFWGPRDAGEGLVNGRVWVAGGARRHRRLGADSG